MLCIPNPKGDGDIGTTKSVAGRDEGGVLVARYYGPGLVKTACSVSSVGEPPRSSFAMRCRVTPSGECGCEGGTPGIEAHLGSPGPLQAALSLRLRLRLGTPPDKGGSVRDCARSGALARGIIITG